MKLLILLAVLTPLALLAGCAPAIVAPAPTSPAPTNGTGVPQYIDPAYEASHINDNWIGPVDMEVDGLSQGATATAPELPPVRIHAGDKNKMNKTWLVTTVDNDTIMTVILPAPLYNGTLPSVTDLESDNTKDNLKLISYEPDTRLLTVGGLIENSVRKVTLTYTPSLPYRISLAIADELTPGFTALPPDYYKWITFDSTIVLVDPRQTVEIPISVQITDEVPRGSRYEVYIHITPASLGLQIGGVAVQREINIRLRLAFK